jgi:tetratricopeptide (TPR) repeat protein
VTAPPPSVAQRAATLHSLGVTASDNGQPATAVRALRAGLRLVDRALPDDEPGLAEIGGRLLISLAWAESERGRVDRGFALLDDAETRIPASQRPILLAQRALLLKRSGRNDLALQQYDAAVAMLDGEANPLDLVKALNNRSLVHVDAGHLRLARADLRRCHQIAERHGMRLHVALSRVNLGCLDVLAGDLPSALGAFAAARSAYAALAPGRLPALAVERARALVAAGLYTEADRELGYAIEHAAAQRLSHTHADALQVRAEAALLADRPEAAALWAGQSRAGFLGRANARRAAVASLWELRARFAAAGEDVGNLAEALSARLHRLGLAEDARVAGLLAARCALRSGASRRAQRIIARCGPPARVDRLDTRLLWRLTQAEVAAAERRSVAASAHLRAGMSTLQRYRTQFGSLDLQTGATVHGRDLARAALAGAIATGRTGEIFRWSERVRAQALLLSAVRPPQDPDAAAALEELRATQHVMRAAEVAGRPTGSLRKRIETLQRTVREHAWSTPGRRGVTGPASASLTSTKQALGTSALVIYVTDGPALLALVIVDGAATLVPLGSLRLADEAIHRLRADLDAQAGRALPVRLAASVAAATHHDAGALAAAILDPLRPRLGDRDLVIVPTGILITVPWPILPGCAGRGVGGGPSVGT